MNRQVLLSRLRDRQVPETLVKWIEAFCTSRQASIVVNEVESPIYDLPQAGLPQGSPPSPILFLFFDADLVQIPITKKRGAIAFVDDFTAWVVRPSAGTNTHRLQSELIPRVEEWERESGASFQLEKIAFTYFTRTKTRLEDRLPLMVKGAEVSDTLQVEILGVVL